MIPKHEQSLQRWAHRLTWLVVVAVACAVTAIGTLVYVGVNRPAEQPPAMKGNITCWMDADGKAVTCGDSRFVKQ